MTIIIRSGYTCPHCKQYVPACKSCGDWGTTDPIAPCSTCGVSSAQRANPPAGAVIEQIRPDHGAIPMLWDRNITDRPGVSADRFRAALDKAREAFWDAIVASFPEVTTGDMGPGEDTTFEWASNGIVQIWLMHNHPAHEERSEHG